MTHPPTDATRLRLVTAEAGGRPDNSRDSDGASAPLLRPSLLATVPSWLLSLVLHAALFVVLAFSLPGLRGGIVGDPDGDLRSIGIWVGHSGDGSDREGNGGRAKGANEVTRTETKATETKLVPAPKGDATTKPIARPQSENPLVAAPPSPVEAHESPAAAPNPVPASPILGPGERPGLFRPTDEPSSTAGKSGDGSAAGKPGVGRRGSRGSTPFFGIVDVGSRFVYVIDCSGSMYSHDAMKAAKKELLQSLRSLTRFQQFQIVFYNTEQKWLKAPGKVDFRFFSADEKSLRLASDFIREIEPEGGTQHLTAIELALRLHPDVVFFLTDGGKPGLSPDDFEELKRLNERHTRIHCVQFSSKDDPDAAEAALFLRKLAGQSDGEYVCRDVTRFDAPSAPRTVARPRGEEH
jgi:Ca-activated chloride channel family protein